jgi:dolichyl-phosphate-mannose--protein O-mannosyl transferase
VQLPTLYFAVLNFAHILDHFVFSSRRLGLPVKSAAFGVCVVAIAGTFWWFKGVAFGIDGPIGEHTGLLWRKVRFKKLSFNSCNELTDGCRPGIYTGCREARWLLK